MRVATDIGGTFTDLVCMDEQSGALYSTKTSTTPANFEQGVIEALRKSPSDPRDVAAFIHGTTIVINTLTERSGAVVGLMLLLPAGLSFFVERALAKWQHAALSARAVQMAPGRNRLRGVLAEVAETV